MSDFEKIRAQLKSYVQNHKTMEKLRKATKTIERAKGSHIPFASLKDKTERTLTFIRGRKELEKKLVKAHEDEVGEEELSKEERSEFEKVDFVVKAAQWNTDLGRILREMQEDEMASCMIKEEPACGTNYFSTAFKKIEQARDALAPKKMEIYFKGI